MIEPKHLPPIHHFLKGHNLIWDELKRELQITYQAQESFTNPRGHAQGGMICAMLDDVMGILANINKTKLPAATCKLTIDFLRPCAVGNVQTKAWFIKEGNTILSIESEAWQNQKLVAKSSSAFVVIAK